MNAKIRYNYAIKYKLTNGTHVATADYCPIKRFNSSRITHALSIPSQKQVFSESVGVKNHLFSIQVFGFFSFKNANFTSELL